MIIHYSELFKTFQSVLLSRGFSSDRAELSAKLFADASLDGVYSHGVNRFPAHVRDIDDGIIQVNSGPSLMDAHQSYERYDGNLGPGNLNAWFCMTRAVSLAKSYGTACVALKNTNHWLRAGNYGWLAADEGCMAICFTNTIPNMPPWGGKDPRIGNNPIVMAVPGQNGEHLVLDMATSQYAYGKLNFYAMESKLLPFLGGFDENGEMTADPGAIIKSQRALPIGLWKGSGLTIMTDLLAAVLSGGDISKDVGLRGREYGLSQVFIAMKPDYGGSEDHIENKRTELIDYIKSSGPAGPDSEILFPGERSLRTRAQNLKHGIPVNDAVWEEINILLSKKDR